MQNFKDRLYNYGVTPPKEIWNNISAELDNTNAKLTPVKGLRKRSKFVFYAITAAASLLIIFISSLLFNKSGEDAGPDSALSKLKGNSALEQKIKDSLYQNNKTLAAIIKSTKDKNLLANNNNNPLLNSKKYITIEGPGGQPVKISSKAATLIVSADNEFPPKPVWSKKIEKWKRIMLSSTFSPTSTSLLDIAQVTSGIGTNE